jgi:hypothetical protein
MMKMVVQRRADAAAVWWQACHGDFLINIVHVGVGTTSLALRAQELQQLPVSDRCVGLWCKVLYELKY